MDVEQALKQISVSASIMEELADNFDASARCMRSAVTLMNAGAYIESVPHMQTMLKLFDEQVKIKQRVIAFVAGSGL